MPASDLDPAAAYRLPEWDERPASQATASWREGYLWMRLARYDEAFTSWSLAERELPAQVAVSSAAALRELGLHAEAEELDLAAARVATAPPVHAAALIGLVADAVGAGDRPLARTRLTAAGPAVSALAPGLAAQRQRIRLGWVEAEVAMLSGEPADVALPRIVAGEVDAPPEYAGGSQHHLAKGLLFAGVLDRDLAALDRAAELAAPCLTWPVQLARRDLGAVGAEAEARAAWREVVPPPAYADQVRGAQGWAS